MRACVEEHRIARHEATGVSYEIIEWDRVRGTARRAQEAIDELIAECHFMMVLFKRSWGSEPGSPWGFTSGTEEELFTALLELGQPDQPMRDVWVAFINDDEPEPGVVDLRSRIVGQHSLLFETIGDLDDLRQKVGDRLRSWEELADHKIPNHVNLTPSSNLDVLRAANLRLKGEKLVELGQLEAGQTALKQAAEIGGPLECLAYARLLRRQGDLEAAYSATQSAIDYFVAHGALYTPEAADAFSAQARVLRAAGRDEEAIGRLEQALTLLRPEDRAVQSVRCRILDDLGLAYQRVGDLAKARRRFAESLETRRALGRDGDIAQSLINIARLTVAEDDLESAIEQAEEASAALHRNPPSSLLANAETLIGQLRLRQGRPDEGSAHAERALIVNRQIGNRHGEAIALLVLAQCSREAGQLAQAREYAQSCLSLNELMGNEVGKGKAQWVLDHLPDS